MAEGGCGARPLELDAVRDGEDSEATAAAIEGDEAIVALGESCECVVAITGDTTMLFRLQEHAVCSVMGPLYFAPSLTPLAQCRNGKLHSMKSELCETWKRVS